MNTAIIVIFVSSQSPILVTLLAAVHVVQQYRRGVVFRLGRVQPAIRGPGMTLVWPVIDRLRKGNMQITMSVQRPGRQGIADRTPALTTSAPSIEPVPVG